MENIIKDYKEGLNIEILCSKYKIGKIKLKNILRTNGIEIRPRGGQKVFKYEYSDFNIEVDGEKEYVIAICKKTNKEFNDYTNKSGSLTSHLKSIGVDVLKSYEGISFYKKNGYHWFTPFFNFEKRKIKDQISCKICGKNFKSNKGGHLTHHIVKEHKITIENYLEKFKSESNYFKKQNKNQKIKCLLCGEEMKALTNTHMKNKHNISVLEYKLKFPLSKIVTDELSQKYKKRIIKFNENIVKSFTSKSEIEIKKFLEEMMITVKTKNKKLFKGMEIDLFLPDYNVGIEYNGVRYHTENFGKKGSKYHLNKTITAYEINKTKLIHIFEDEWEMSKDIVKSKLKHIFNNNYSNKIYGRKCLVKSINKQLSDQFLNKNHIQGAIKASYYYGLFHEDNLISVMTFSKKNDKVYELSRFASDINLIVIGGASKLLKYFVNKEKPNEIISFADRRWTVDVNNNMYIKLGFKHVKTTKPDYKYFNSSVHRFKRLHKFGFRKNILLRKYPDILNKNMTEKQMTEKLGFDRIWDCGLFKFSLILN